MPGSPLMQEYQVRQATSGILLCITLALIPPVLEAQALVVYETVCGLKNTIFFFHNLQTTAWIACLWTILFTMLNTFLAEMLVHHQYDQKHKALTFMLHLVLPPLGLVSALNEFAVLQTGRGSVLDTQPSLYYTILSWGAMNLLYFAILMILQRTNTSKLRPIKTPTGRERAMLQEVDELVAKAISFRSCSKTIMNVPILSDVTLDIYRGEFTILFAQRIQEKMIVTIEDLLTGLTSPDEGTITVLGHTVTPDRSFMSMQYMMGYCHDPNFLIEDLTVEEHLILFTEICLWYESTQYWTEYLEIRTKRLYSECDLESVRHMQVWNLGREYRVRMTFRGSYGQDDEVVSELVQAAVAVGGSVRAHLGSLLILRLPAAPTHAVAALIAHFDRDANKYGIVSMSISLPDTEEVTKRSTSPLFRQFCTRVPENRDTKATEKEIQDIRYTALAYTESMTEYLVTRAIDSPQHYVYMYAYGTDISSNELGETTIIAKLFYGEGLNYALYFMRLSPQFNMAYAYVKIKQIFLYNSECVLFKSRNLCKSANLHKCCDKCGILQECFSRKEYFTRIPGILVELVSIIGTAVLFTVLLLLWEYRILQRIFRFMITKWFDVEKSGNIEEGIGLKREKADVTDKLKEMQFKRREKVDTFGEYLLVDNVNKKEDGYYTLRNINFGVGKGEVLALSGLKRHGRVKLCEILAGYKIPTTGQVWSMSRWKLKEQPYKYTRNLSISCERSPLPHWMKVYDALVLLAVLRGVPQKHVADELTNYIDALGNF
ncbi:unnamed protein product [Diatraea saccharalis]|uniref:Uncharacterized protein n=1 Tax=Diatraea saccharalis TaxID=40085 RepID=A0A9N9RHZ1_9NEOP|nr:unnamed protein product [Diatraea saccharalis]